MFHLNPSPFEPSALEPLISARTIDFHYNKHHKTYVDNLNNLLPNSPFNKLKTIEEVFLAAAENNHMALFNNAGQVYNHDFYWKSIEPHKNSKPQGKILSYLKDHFQSYENFLAKFKEAALTQFGSGWAWLVEDRATGKWEIMKTANADNPLCHNKKPLLTIDVWEHAYYLDYQNKRVAYLEAFLENLLNWNFVQENLEK